MKNAKYIVGIDFGTTNSAVAYTEILDSTDNAENRDVKVFEISQLVNDAELKPLKTLPSFCYIPEKNEFERENIALPWDKKMNHIVGTFARKIGENTPYKLISSAKSWLCHEGIDRKSRILPWGNEDKSQRISTVEAITNYLQHIREAWNYTMAVKDKSKRLENQDIYLTVPASFDAVARELTVLAAKKAGLKDITLLEEPMSAFYAWLKNNEESWREKVQLGDTILVCDVGGGTTDFSLITVNENAGNLELERIAVGNHILLGGDNMDLALAQYAKEKLRSEGHRLDLRQTLELWHKCREAKETLLSGDKDREVTVSVTGSGTSLVGGLVQVSLNIDEISNIILGGFLADCDAKAEVNLARKGGLQELGLQYAAEPNILKHIISFLRNNKENDENFKHPTAILFNGGVFKTEKLREKIASALNSWLVSDNGKAIRVLANDDYDLAVAIGASYFGQVKAGTGVRIRGGLARSYYIGIETAMPAVPGMTPPVKCLCVAPFGLEEGSDIKLPAKEFGLVVGETAEFRFFSATNRQDDIVGDMIDDWEFEGIEELAPIELKLDIDDDAGSQIPVTLKAKSTDIGTLELWFVSRDKKREWKLEFNVRGR